MGTHNLPHLMIALIGCSLLALALASSHSEAPGTAKGPRADLTDVYAFKSRKTGRGDYVALVMNVGVLQQSQAGPNYNPLDTDFVYQFHIDNNGDAVEDLTFQFVIGERFNNDGQGLVIPVTLGGETRQVPVALNHIGQVDETQATLNLQQYTVCVCSMAPTTRAASTTVRGCCTTKAAVRSSTNLIKHTKMLVKRRFR